MKIKTGTIIILGLILFWGAIQLLSLVYWYYHFLLISSLHSRILHLVAQKAKVWAEYKVLFDVISLEQSSGGDDHRIYKRKKFDVSLVTQCSINNLKYLLDLLDRWSGPVSVSVFTPGQHFLHAYLAVNSISRCFSSRDLSFHFVFPAMWPPLIEDEDFEIWNKQFYGGADECEQIIKVLQLLNVTSNYALGNIPYPHNTLRNVAKRRLATTHMLLLDVDVVPSPDTRESFLRKAALDRNAVSDLCVYVTPAFEIKSNSPIPASKKELVQAIKLQRVRTFHVLTCPLCHKATK